MQFQRTEQHERMIVFRLGRLQPIKGPSYVFVLPWVDKWQKVNLRMRAFIIPPQQLLLSDGAIVEIGAEIRFRIADLIKSVTHVQNLDHSVRVLGQALLKNTMNHKTLTELKAEKLIISSSLLSEMNATVKSWGVEVSQVEISPYKMLQDSNSHSSSLGTVMSSFQKALRPNSDLVQPLPFGACRTTDNFSEGSVIHSIMLDQVFPTALTNGDANLTSTAAIFKLCVLSDKSETYWLNMQQGKTAVGEGIPEGWSSPDVSITISASNLLSIAMGKLSPLQAYIGGHVLVDGDSRLLYSLQHIFSKMDLTVAYK